MSRSSPVRTAGPLLCRTGFSHTLGLLVVFAWARSEARDDRCTGVP